MKYGICVCGLNGCGKTTLARALAEALKFRHMDAEDYFFLPAEIPYSHPRSREEAQALLLADMREMPHFVFSAVNGDMGEEINVMYRLVVYLETAHEVRMERIQKRAYDRFGDRMLPGGDLYEQEQAFLDFAASRSADRVEVWLRTLPCRLLRLDGTASINANIDHILSFVRETE